MDKPERRQAQLRVGQLALNAYHPDVDALWLGVVAFGGTFTSPLTQQVRDERGWSYVAQADMRRRSRHRAPITLRSAPTVDNVLPCLSLELELLAALGRGELPSQEALQMAQCYVLGRTPFEVASAHARLGLVVSLRLLGLPMDEVDQLPARWEGIDLRAIPALLPRHLAAGQVVATVVAPAAQIEKKLAAAFPEAPIEVVDFRDSVCQDG